MELISESMTFSLKKSILILASFTVLAVGCQFESMSVSPTEEQSVDYRAISESYSPNTKTAMSGFDVVWSEGDQVAIFQANNKADRFAVTAESAGSTTAGFVLDEDIPDGDQIASAIAYYPYTPDLMLVENRVDIEVNKETLMVPDGTYSLLGINFPTTQKYQVGSFANGAFPMVAVTAEGEDNFFEMKNILGAIKLQITGDKDVKSITIAGRPTVVDNTYKYNSIAGIAQSVKFSPVADPVVYMNADEPSATSVTLDCGDGVALSPSVPTDFIISLVPTVFESGFIVTVVDTDGVSYQMTATAENEIQRSKVLVMPEIDLDDMTPVLEVTADPGMTDVDLEFEIMLDDVFGFYGIFAPKDVWEIYAGAFTDPVLVEGLLTGGFASEGLPCNYYFDTAYEGKLSHFGLDPDLADDEYCNDVYPNSAYYLVIVPELEDKEEYTLADFLIYEVQTKSLSKGGNVKLPDYTVIEGFFSSEVNFNPSKDISMVMYRIFDADEELPTSENYLDMIRKTADYSSKDGFTINVASAPGVLPGQVYKVCVVLVDSKNKSTFHVVDVNTKAIPYDETVSVEIGDPSFSKTGTLFSAEVTYPKGATELYFIIDDQMIVDDYRAAEYIAGVLDGTTDMICVDLDGASNKYTISSKAKVNFSRPLTNYAHLFVKMESGKVSHLVTSKGVVASLK